MIKFSYAHHIAGNEVHVPLTSTIFQSQTIFRSVCSLARLKREKSFIDVFYHQIRSGIQGYTTRAPPLSRGGSPGRVRTGDQTIASPIIGCQGMAISRLRVLGCFKTEFTRSLLVVYSDSTLHSVYPFPLSRMPASIGVVNKASSLSTRRVHDFSRCANHG